MAPPAQRHFWNPLWELSDARQKHLNIHIPSGRYEQKAQKDSAITPQINLIFQHEYSTAGCFFFVNVCDQNWVSLGGYFKGRHKPAKSHTTFSKHRINLDLAFSLLKCWKEMWGSEWDDHCKKTGLVLLPLLLCPKATIRSGIPLCQALSKHRGRNNPHSKVCSID